MWGAASGPFAMCSRKTAVALSRIGSASISAATATTATASGTRWEGHYELMKLNLQNPMWCAWLNAIREWVRLFDIDGRPAAGRCLPAAGYLRALRALQPEAGLCCWARSAARRLQPAG